VRDAYRSHNRRRYGAAGFSFGGAALRHQSEGRRLDLTILAADGNASAAGIFTTNLAQAAPVLSPGVISSGATASARAIVVNSGCANACTGTQGMADADRMAAEVATMLGQSGAGAGGSTG
jgi:glutamate N-acetyltransferase/amino-acid N-acetyltransferase